MTRFRYAAVLLLVSGVTWAADPVDWDKQLDSAYRTAAQGVDATRQGLMEDAQHAWAAFRDAQCKLATDTAQCRARMAEARVAELKVLGMAAPSGQPGESFGDPSRECEGRTAQMTQCATKIFNATDKRLKEIYDQRLAAVGDATQKAFFAEQHASWKKFLEQTCTADMEDAGTLKNFEILNCKTEHSVKRLNLMKNGQDCGEYKCP
jgi:uncharacterized protein YecT (DUF1311 family)